MNNMQAEAILAAEPNHQPNGFEFCLIRPRRKIGGVASPIRISQSIHRSVDWACEFCVHEERETRLGDEGKRRLQLLLVDHGEAVAAGVDEEALEAENSGARERQTV